MEHILDTVTDPNSTRRYVRLVDRLTDEYNVSQKVTDALWNFTGTIFQAELDNNYAKPTSWIGLYIAAASLLCVFAMAADLLHGLRNRKLWFPCKYFIVNAAFLSVISAAMKLPMDITASMPGNVDQVTKLGSMAFLCTMMANFLPSLATMNSKELLTNITGLGVMVITLVVNVCIQIQTGVVSSKRSDQFYHRVLSQYYFSKPTVVPNKNRNITIAAIYMTLLILLLIIHLCSCLAILKSKKTIDDKYQVLHEAVSKDLQPHEAVSKDLQPHEAVSKDLQPDTLTVEKLRQHVGKYWIMAGSPQFITVCFVTTSACGVICGLSTALHIRTLFWTIGSVEERDYESDYQWSILVIFIIQFIGVILGTIAPLCRCFVALCFKVSMESIKNHFMVFKVVEPYWTEKLYDWKPKSITLPFHSHKCKVITEHVKIFFLKFCIAFQVAVVVTCKIISLVPFFMICVLYCLMCLMDKGKVVVSGNKKQDPEDFRQYVLHLQDEMEISEKTLKGLSKSTILLIKKGERRQPQDLLELIKKSIVENFERDHVTSLLSQVDYCWSLLVVILTTIAVSLPDIEKKKAKTLLGSVRKGLEYVRHVEQSLNTTDDSVRSQKVADSVRSQKVAETLWHEFEVYKKWFGNNMQEIASKKTTSEIAQWFKEKDHKDGDDNSKCESYAKPMNLITEILLSYATDDFNQQFEHISRIISGILANCLTNLPKVIAAKCHISEIEKREATVQAEAILLGETTQIIKTLQGHDPDPQQCLKCCACFYHKI